MEDESSIPEPDPEVPVEKPDVGTVSERRRHRLYAVSYEPKSGAPFSLQVRRVETGSVIFNTSVPGFTFSTQFIQISTILPSSNVYGLGGSGSSGENRKWTVFAGRGSRRLHPFHLCLEDDDGNAHGILLHTSYPLDMELSGTVLTYRVLGGHLDFYVFLGPEPEAVVRQYTEAVGRPFLPPYWSLGFQVDHRGTKDMTEVRQSLRDVERHGVPYDVVTLGSGYRIDGLDYTVDHQRFPGIHVLAERLRRTGRHLDVEVRPTVDVGYASGTYATYDDARRYGVFVNSSVRNEPSLGHAMFGRRAAFVDFGHPQVGRWWNRTAERLWDIVPYDGVTLVDNDPVNRRNGSEDRCVRDNYNRPPFVPRALSKAPIFWNTVCLDGVQWQKHRKVHHYAVHNSYGYSMSRVVHGMTWGSRVGKPKRGSVMSQSTWTGSGKYAGFWDTNNARTWDHLRDSIGTVLDYNVYGVPLVGSAICGSDVFLDDLELCQRWMQLGAFYPFSRMVHDPIFCDKEFGTTARLALEVRHALLPYLYTLFYRASTVGGTVARRMFHEFRRDRATYNLTAQFMWGSAVLIAPTVTKGQRVTDVYLPRGTWYLFGTGARLESCGEYIGFEAPLDRPNVFLRSGHIVPTHSVPASSTGQSRNGNFRLVVGLDEHQRAAGEFFWDDGTSPGTVPNGEYVVVNFSVAENRLVVTGTGPKPIPTSAYFDSVDVLGLPHEPHLVAIGGTMGVLGTRQFRWEPRAQVAQLRNIILPLSGTVEIFWRFT